MTRTPAEYCDELLAIVDDNKARILIVGLAMQLDHTEQAFSSYIMNRPKKDAAAHFAIRRLGVLLSKTHHRKCVLWDEVWRIWRDACDGYISERDEVES